MKRQEEIEKKRIQKLERENKRWEIADQEFVKNMDKIKSKAEEQRQGVRRTATSNGYDLFHN
jgi:molecular chaperone GrpE (heat shock protein)